MPLNGSSEESAGPSCPLRDLPGNVKDDNQFGIAWMEAAISANLDTQPRTKAAPREELHCYLSAPRELEVDNVIRWWGVSLLRFSISILTQIPIQHHRHEYPVLSRCAKDYLAIPGSSSASERLFSAERRIVTDHRTLLKTKSIENLQMLRSAYSVGDLSVAKLLKN